MAASYAELSRRQGMREQDLRTLIEGERLQQIAERRPADPLGYKTELSADFVKSLNLPEGKEAPKLDEKNPVLAWWRETAHEMGLGQDGFEKGIQQFVAWQLGAARDAGKAEQTRVAGEKEKLGEKAQERLDAVDAWLKTTCTEAEYGIMQMVCTSAIGVQLIEKLMGKTGTPPIPTGHGTGASGAVDRGALQKMMMDPRYSDPFKRDAGYVAEVQRHFQRLYPGQVPVS